MRYRRLIAPAWVIALIVIGSTLAPATVSAQGGPQDRPGFPEEQTTATEHFLIHYTYVTDDRVSHADADVNGTSDYVESAASALEFAWQKQVVEMGWAAPPGDQGQGGDDRVDVYLENDMANGIAGYTDSNGGMVGDNPNTPAQERSASYSYLSIDNDFAEVDLPGDETPEHVMQATVAHEFNHVLQAGYDSLDPQTWLYEATATWMEAQVYPDITDSLNYLPDLLDHPETCLASKKVWYASWLFMQFLSEQFGPEVVRSIWEHSRQVDGYQAIDDALAPLQTSLVAQSRDFAIANLLRAYSDGESYPATHQGGELDGEGTVAPETMVSSLGASYIRLGGGGQVTVSFAGKQSLSARVVSIRGDEADVFDFVEGRLVVDLGQYQETYVVVHGDDLINIGNRCFASDFAVTVGPGDGTPAAAAATWPATHYAPLSTAITSDTGSSSSFHQPYEGSHSAKSPDDLEVDFETIVPAPPDGYYFDYAYTMTPKDLGASASFYVPDADKSANYDYLNAAGDWLSVSESPTGYESLQDWQEGIQYQPGATPETINGIEVLFEDTGAKKEGQVSATFIHRGLFVVVDGDGSREDVLGMVLAVINVKKGDTITPQDKGGTQAAPPQLATPTPEQLPDIPPGTGIDSLFVFGAVSVCGLGLCLAGIGVVLVVMLIRRKGGTMSG